MSGKTSIWIAGDENVFVVKRKSIFSGKLLPAEQELEIYKAVPGERVQIIRPDGKGNYSVRLPPGTYFVTAAKPASPVQVDAALAKPIHPEMLDSSVCDVGEVRGEAAADLGQPVKKSGRSTGLTYGHVIVIGATVTVNFTAGRTARFVNQIITGKMGSPGDSGSLLLDEDNNALGLLFAGSDLVTVYHPISEITEQLAVRVTKEKYPWPAVYYRQNRYRELEEICKNAIPALLSLPNVVGAGIGHKTRQGFNSGRACITVLVSKKNPLDDLPEEERIPSQINGVLTDVLETGELAAVTGTPAAGNDPGRTGRMRPARPGISIGHYLVTAGTLGAVVYDARTSEPLILSNNHVLANSSNGSDGRAKLGDPILQPGAGDGGSREHDVIGRLHRFYPLHFL